ncbi:endonuclease/exonuclease/phosphatase family protein [Herbivorax sp. ANBcel31]|uniref:endonuclease/exonuclease/phosphatase family protein n=1 Tax=Herbivorax sp. ANBcel31 TaxID=3069754 RepID=UPI0027B792F5|nr:endonuclease/exonuclease/phosphatase family protein [Herbivorax sp. ANBcel31]MDQ2084946.1 endonuclease/exonuclease/phosphatase family protein [Herbivorax sp. ANBcel31]
MSDCVNKKSYFKSISIKGLVEALFALFFICNVVGYFGRFAWYLELFAHFKFQYFVVAILFTVTFLLLKTWKFLSLAILVLGVNFFHIAPFYLEFSSSDYVMPENSNTLNLISFNVYTDNDNYEGVIEYIKSENPELFVLQEVNREWIENIQPLFEIYEYSLIKPREDNFGIALLSKIPLKDKSIEYYGGSRVPNVVADFMHNGKEVTIIGTHPLPPMGANYFEDRNNQLRDLASKRSEFSDSLIVIGDLNTTSWTNIFKEFSRDMDVYDTRLGKGIQPTWPSMIPFFKIPIDHCLVSEDITVIERKTGSDLGSDHKPILVELAVN